jgi:hypothetical protein
MPGQERAVLSLTSLILDRSLGAVWRGLGSLKRRVAECGGRTTASQGRGLDRVIGPEPQVKNDCLIEILFVLYPKLGMGRGRARTLSGRIIPNATTDAGFLELSTHAANLRNVR